MSKVLKSVCIDVEAETLANGNIPNLSEFLNESIYAFCAKDLSEAARVGIPADKLLTQQLLALKKEYAATAAELEAVKEQAAKEKTDLEYQLLQANHKIERLEIKTKKRLKEQKPIGRAAKIAELKKQLESPDLTEEEKAPIISEIAKLVRSLPEDKEAK